MQDVPLSVSVAIRPAESYIVSSSSDVLALDEQIKAYPRLLRIPFALLGRSEGLVSGTVPGPK